MSIRDYNEKQFLTELNQSIPDEALRGRLERMYERDHTTIERKEDELQKAYKSIPSVLEATSKLTGLEPDTLLTVVGRASAFMSMPWYEMLSIIRAYYVQLNRVREEYEQAARPK